MSATRRTVVRFRSGKNNQASCDKRQRIGFGDVAVCHDADVVKFGRGKGRSGSLEQGANIDDSATEMGTQTIPARTAFGDHRRLERHLTHHGPFQFGHQHTLRLLRSARLPRRGARSARYGGDLRRRQKSRGGDHSGVFLPFRRHLDLRRQ